MFRLKDLTLLAAAASPPRLFTLVLLSALSVLSLNMFLPSLSNIAEAFQADYALVNLSVAGYAGMTAVLQLIMGPLSDRFGRRPVLLVGLAIFILASLGCLLATNIWVFLLFRMLQGAIICGWVLSNAVIRDLVPAQEAASLMGYLAMAWAVAPMLGPMFGGALDELFGWRASFLAFVGFGVAILGLCWVDLGETNKAPSDTFMKQFQTYPELFRSRRFWGYSLCMAFSTGAFYAFLSGIPLVAQTVFELPPARLGVYMGTITAGFFLGSFLSGRYAKQHHAHKLVDRVLFGHERARERCQHSSEANRQGPRKSRRAAGQFRTHRKRTDVAAWISQPVADANEHCCAEQG